MSETWDLTILDADPPVTSMGSLAVGDLDGDGHEEIVVGGAGKLLWYRPDTLQRGTIADGEFAVGLALHDVDADGRLEVVAGHRTGGGNGISWYKPGRDLAAPWTSHLIDPAATGSAHDLLLADVDNDGRAELIANAAYSAGPGLFLYKPGSDPARPWAKHAVQEGFFAEGTDTADVDADGQAEIVCGPHLFHAPPGGPFAGPWHHSVVAPPFREMCRAAFLDITGTARPDIVIAESEFLDGRAAWIENRVLEEPHRPWVLHEIDRPLYYAHSLHVRIDAPTARPTIFLAEMAEGGWHAPRNHDARLIEYATPDRGRTWLRTILRSGSGTHQATVCDVDRDGRQEVVGKEWGSAQRCPRVQLFKRPAEQSPLARFEHRIVDRDKPDAAIDLVPADLTGDGRIDIACGSWWYRNGDWRRFDLPADFEVIAAADLDGDGRAELVGVRRTQRGYGGLTSRLVWLKAADPLAGKWRMHEIGAGGGDWPHGSLVAPLLPGRRLALVCGYHSAERHGHRPELFEVPDDPTQSPWPKRVLADIPYGEEFAACDLDGDGRLDLVAGPWWLRNLGDGQFRPHRYAPEALENVARVAVADLNGDGRPDVVLGEEELDFQNKRTPISKLLWLANPADPAAGPWDARVIDKVRCAHSVAAADLDGDGEAEVVCGEHDPFYPYRSRCRLLVYKKADPSGRAWKQYVLDDRFEHHDGARVLEVSPGRLAIASHGWKDSRYVHLYVAPER